jgi:hypothetical protein
MVFPIVYNKISNKKTRLLLFCTIPLFVFAQNNTIERDTVGKKDIINVIKILLHRDLNKTPEKTGKKIYYSFLPVSSQVPGAGIALVTSTTAGFYLGDRANTSLSTVAFSPYITFSGRVGC